MDKGGLFKMAFKEVLNTRFQLLCDTSEAWELNNPKVLLKNAVNTIKEKRKGQLKKWECQRHKVDY